MGFVGLDILSLVDYAVEPESNPIADFCSSKGYRTVENVIFGIAAFTGGASKSMTCFVAGTMILTVTGLVAIENIKAGDKVISTDPETFETAEKRVLETYIREDSKLIHLVINGEEIVTTETHPFYVNNRGFVNAGELIVGDELLDVNGNVLLVENFDVELTDEPVTVYNFQVEDFHTYHVSGFGVLVHNASRKYSSTKEFNEAISKMDTSERVATVKQEARAVADNNGLSKNNKLSRINNRDVYSDPKTKDLYAVDSQHGTFEHCNRRGKHLGEVDFDFNNTKPADTSGQHDLIVK